MRETLRQVVFGVAALFLVGALCSIGQASPGFNSADCTSCHDNEGLDFDVAPNILKLAPGDSGQFDFDILAIPDETRAALAVRELNDPDIDLVSVGGGWTDHDPGVQPVLPAAVNHGHGDRSSYARDWPRSSIWSL